MSDKQYGIKNQRNTRACIVLVLCSLSFLSSQADARSRYRDAEEPYESVEDERPSGRRGSGGGGASVERFELVAEDASAPGSIIPNNWGLHQPRITRHSDGSIRLLYLTQRSSNALTWRLMYRTTSGEWGQEASGATTDDVALLRDSRTDRAHVLAWPKSVPTVFTSPTFKGAAIPGGWQKMPSSSRHYGNAGISRDGTLCLKASRELPGKAVTAATNTEYVCGNFSSASKKWRWSGMVKHPTGARHAYDYIFPNPAGLPKGLYATATSDIHKAALGVDGLAVQGNYVFNGIRVYSAGLDSAKSWKHVETRLPVRTAGRKKAAPTFRLQEGLIDSKGRIFSNYYVEDPQDDSMRGLYVTVNNSKGKLLFEEKWKLPAYGYTRLFEDARSRLWLIWTAQGTRRTEVHLYRVMESSSGDGPSFSLGSRIDLSEAFIPYAIQGNLYVAVPRGGNDRTSYVDAIFNACSATYKSKTNFDSKRCYGSKNQGEQQVFYTRIRLPG